MTLTKDLLGAPCATWFGNKKSERSQKIVFSNSRSGFTQTWDPMTCNKTGARSVVTFFLFRENPPMTGTKPFGPEI